MRSRTTVECSEEHHLKGVEGGGLCGRGIVTEASVAPGGALKPGLPFGVVRIQTWEQRSSLWPIIAYRLPQGGAMILG